MLLSFSGTHRLYRLDRSPLSPPIVHAPRAAIPILLSLPHSGRDYPHWLVANAAGGKAALESLEDPLVDRLIWRALAGGVGAVIAKAPRAAIDCNRSTEDVDPAVIADAGGLTMSVRARSGLGIVPSRTAPHGRLWRRPIDQAELARRVAEAHAPFHDAVAEALGRLVAAHGSALLIDCHSMPRRGGQAQIVIGDRHGGSAAPWLGDQAARIARSNGWSARLNEPYAGGYVVERHGRPDRGVHAVQLEIDRSCYLARDGRNPGPGFDRAARLIEQLVLELAEALTGPEAIAAE